MEKRCYIFFTIIGLLFSIVAKAQEKEAKLPIRYLNTWFYGGKIVVHSSRMEHFRNVSPRGIGIDYEWKFVSEKAYSLCQCYPSIGASLNFRDFGDSSLGHALSGLFYVEPVLFSPLNIDISFKAGLGISYLSNPYDESNNPENVAYSTHFSFPLLAGLSFKYPVGDRWALRLAGTFQHISNGGTNQPNLGINYTALGIGVQRKLDTRSLPSKIELQPYDRVSGEKKWYFNIIAGLKEPEGSEDKALVLSAASEYMSQFARINAWTAGVMAEFDNSRDYSDLGSKSRLSFMVGHTFLLGRFAFGQKAGIYVWSGHATHAPWYQYYTLDFEVSEKIAIGTGLKAHGKVAEFLGMRFLLSPF